MNRILLDASLQPVVGEQHLPNNRPRMEVAKKMGKVLLVIAAAGVVFALSLPLAQAIIATSLAAGSVTYFTLVHALAANRGNHGCATVLLTTAGTACTIALVVLGIAFAPTLAFSGWSVVCGLVCARQGIAEIRELCRGRSEIVSIEEGLQCYPELQEEIQWLHREFGFTLDRTNAVLDSVLDAVCRRLPEGKLSEYKSKFAPEFAQEFSYELRLQFAREANEPLFQTPASPRPVAWGFLLASPKLRNKIKPWQSRSGFSDEAAAQALTRIVLRAPTDGSERLDSYFERKLSLFE